MKKLLEERERCKRGTEALDESEVAPRTEKKRKAEQEKKSGDTDELRKLVESAKKKAKR